MISRKKLTKEQALQKLKHYCSYQERSHNEVNSKLYDLGISTRDHDELVAELIQSDHLNEERFAIAFANGKFRLKQWGRVKIKYELKQKKISEYCIEKALKQINETDYLKVLEKLCRLKYASLRSDQHLIRKKRTIDYLVQKGFEMTHVINTVNGFTKP
jgi:regulatory protein